MNLTTPTGRGEAAPVDACEALAAALRTVGQPLAVIDDVINEKLGLGRERREPAPIADEDGPAVDQSIAEGHLRLLDAVIGQPGLVTD